MHIQGMSNFFDWRETIII